MATYHTVENVKYLCDCGKLTPFALLYFCKHCIKLRCSKCVSHEVDNHYCPSCLENTPSAEAKLKKNRCVNCFDCPSCGHSLSTRATAVVNPEPSSPVEPDSATDSPQSATGAQKKVYYLACAFCRWTTRDIGVKDQHVASGGWHEPENPDAKRISALIEHYQLMALAEITELTKKKTPLRRRALMQYGIQDKYGLTSVVARHRAGLPQFAAMKGDSKVPIDAEQSEAVDDVEALPDEYFSQPVNLANVCTVPQRLIWPERQPEKTADMYPCRKQMLVKRSRRCRECEHNLIKPDFTTTSIKFKMQLTAMLLVPEVRILPGFQIHPGKESRVVLTLSNPSQFAVHVFLLPSDREDDIGNCKVILPKSELVLSPQDDIAEFDDSSEALQGSKDDPQIVAFRRANKIGVVVKVVTEKSNKEPVISFILKYDYKQKSPGTEEYKTHWLQQYVTCDLTRLVC